MLKEVVLSFRHENLKVQEYVWLLPHQNGIIYISIINVCMYSLKFGRSFIWKIVEFEYFSSQQLCHKSKYF